MAKKRSPSPRLARSPRAWALPTLFVCVLALAASLGPRLAVPAASVQAANQLPPSFAPTIETPHLVYTELKGQQSSLWIAPAGDLSRAQRLALVGHRAGYGLTARIGPSGRQIAYLTLPPDAVDSSAQAALWVMDLQDNAHRRLLVNVDLHSAPVWSADGAQLLVRRTLASGDSIRYTLLAVDVATGVATKLIADIPADGIYPIGWSRDGSGVYFASLTRTGTDIRRLDLATQRATTVLHASDGIARDFRLSARDGRLLYSEYLPTRAKPYRVRIADLGAATSTLLLESREGLISPLWQPGGREITVGSAPTEPRLHGGVGTLSPQAGWAKDALIPAPQGGFLLPLAWSSDGAFLAARLLSGDELRAVTDERLVVVVSATGAVTPIETDGYAAFVGWRE